MTKQIALHKIKVAAQELTFGSPKKNKTPKGFVGWLEMNISFLESAKKIFQELDKPKKEDTMKKDKTELAIRQISEI